MPGVVRERYLQGASLKELAVPDSAVLSFAKQQGMGNREALQVYSDQMKEQRVSDPKRTQEEVKCAAAGDVEECLRQAGPWHLVSRTGDSVYFSYGGTTYRVDVSVARR